MTKATTPGAHPTSFDDTGAAIARLVKARRTRLGLSIADLAAATGLAPAALADLEARQEDCSAADLWRIARAFGASMSELCPPAPTQNRPVAARSFAGPDPATQIGGAGMVRH